jgi:tetratricopeptide (TPR) repeat protein
MADDASTRFVKALEHKINGEYDDAEALFKSVLAEQPNNADAYHELGLTYGFRAYMDESISALERAVALNSSNARYLISLGKTYAMWGEDDKARSLFQRVLQIDPFNDEAQSNLDYLG